MWLLDGTLGEINTSGESDFAIGRSKSVVIDTIPVGVHNKHDCAIDLETLRKFIGLRVVNEPDHLAWKTRADVVPLTDHPAIDEKQRRVSLVCTLIVQLGRETAERGMDLAQVREFNCRQRHLVPFTGIVVTCTDTNRERLKSGTKVSNVGHSECKDLSELLPTRAEVELGSGASLEDVETSAEEDLPAGIRSDGSVMDGLVPLNIELDSD